MLGKQCNSFTLVLSMQTRNLPKLWSIMNSLGAYLSVRARARMYLPSMPWNVKQNDGVTVTIKLAWLWKAKEAQNHISELSHP